MSTKVDIIGNKLNIPTDIITIIKEYYYDDSIILLWTCELR